MTIKIVKKISAAVNKTSKRDSLEPAEITDSKRDAGGGGGATGAGIDSKLLEGVGLGDGLETQNGSENSR